MPVERANLRFISKPWGVSDLGPWAAHSTIDGLIGEVVFECSTADHAPPELLLKLLFTSKALSVQVHPDDAYAATLGLPRGKSEAWYILRAAEGAKVALGLNRTLARDAFRAAIVDGSIAGLLDWRDVAAGDVFMVPAGTIHAIGAGIVVAEIQQNSDATFRLLDGEHGRDLHIEHAVAAARSGPAACQASAERLSAVRTRLVASPHFNLERLVLPADADFQFTATSETWLLCLSGTVRSSAGTVSTGDALFTNSDPVDLRSGSAGMTCLVAYTVGAALLPDLLPRLAATVR